MVVRDSTTKVCLCPVSCEDNIESGLHAKLKAILFGLEVARTHFSKFLFIESGSFLTISKISKANASFCE
ncbi:hypothetical protein CRYUN_Cryun07bG0073600 [Craigia yunnanensis]